MGADEHISPNYDGVVEVPGEITTIQGAINVAVSGDSIKVAAGTYTENIDYGGKNLVIISTAGRATTIIDGNQSGSVVKFISGEDSTAVLMGFTITNGAAENGGGIHLDQSSPSLYDLTVSQNTASSTGGGIYCDDQSNFILKNSSVVNNSAGQHGGGIRCHNDSNIKLENVVIANNTASQFGGAIHCRSNPSLTLMNVTIINNNADDFGGGIYLRAGSSPIIVNSIVWGNTPQNIYFRAGEGVFQGNITFSYSDLQGGQDSIVTNETGTVTWGDGNLDVDPMFTDMANGDYSLTADSRCIDTGHPDSTDADGTVADMGAYYYDQAGQPIRVRNLITTPSADNVAVKWNANSDAASYNIYRSTDVSADFYNMSQYATAADSFYVDDGADEFTTFHYRVSAVDGDGDEGILAFARHGRTGSDSTALAS
jgi:predicted outer membrane repeat protein